MKYPLEDLLRVRNFREDNAAGELTKRRREVQQSEALVEQRKKELADYIQWRVAREEALYQDIIRKRVQRKELDDLKIEIQLLREKEFAFEDRLVEAKKALEEAQQAVEKALAQYRAAMKDRQKIDEHKGIWAQEAEKISEAKQELEIEDFRVIGFDEEISEEN